MVVFIQRLLRLDLFPVIEHTGALPGRETSITKAPAKMWFSFWLVRCSCFWTDVERDHVVLLNFQYSCARSWKPRRALGLAQAFHTYRHHLDHNLDRCLNVLGKDNQSKRALALLCLPGGRPVIAATRCNCPSESVWTQIAKTQACDRTS